MIKGTKRERQTFTSWSATSAFDEREGRRRRRRRRNPKGRVSWRRPTGNPLFSRVGCAIHLTDRVFSCHQWEEKTLTLNCEFKLRSDWKIGLLLSGQYFQLWSERETRVSRVHMQRRKFKVAEFGAASNQMKRKKLTTWRKKLPFFRPLATPLYCPSVCLLSDGRQSSVGLLRVHHVTGGGGGGGGHRRRRRRSRNQSVKWQRQPGGRPKWSWRALFVARVGLPSFLLPSNQISRIESTGRWRVEFWIMTSNITTRDARSKNSFVASIGQPTDWLVTQLSCFVA